MDSGIFPRSSYHFKNQAVGSFTASWQSSHKPKKNLPKKDKGKASSLSPIPAAQQEVVTAPKKNKGKEKASILPPAAHNLQQAMSPEEVEAHFKTLLLP
ncbi:hypothetical protein [Parasitella parasitica]|uniref:Uncharacterized protein n=1 Tax=Parasitella parasitica TaxID=35722 RepID=A0A0B7MW15_9FUNG|nr:hypothetical protein [Parasitella parasitica]